MSRITRERQAMIRWYKRETGQLQVDMHEVAKFAVAHNWPLPQPTDPLDRLAEQFSHAARVEIKHDEQTGRPYRVNHAVPHHQPDGRQLSYLWIDIDEAPRGPMWKSLINRREQMVGDALQLTFDKDHWNAMHPDEDPIEIPLDFSDDVEWRKNAPDEKSA
jgi:hypothetical protein